MYCGTRMAYIVCFTFGVCVLLFYMDTWKRDSYFMDELYLHYTMLKVTTAQAYNKEHTNV